MSDIPRLQAYLRTSAGQRYDTAAVPPFTLYFHPSTDFSSFNYAIPNAPVTGDVSDALARLRATFEARSRLPRFEFIEEFSGVEIACLTAADRDAGRVCERAGFQPVATMLAYDVQR